MKVMVGHSGDTEPQLSNALEEVLAAEEFHVELLHLTPIDELEPMRSVAYWRLLPIDGVADVLLCLDPIASLLRHSHKCVCLLGGFERLPEGRPTYFDKLVLAGIREAKALFASDKTAERVRSFGFPQVTLIDSESMSGARSSGRFKGRAPLLKALRS